MATTVCRARFNWLLIILAPTVLATLSLAQNASPISSGSGIYRGHRGTFQMVKGKMIFEGDITLEHIDQKLPEKNLQPGGTLDYLQYRWPQVGSVYQIPYTIDPSSGDVANINAEVAPEPSAWFHRRPLATASIPVASFLLSRRLPPRDGLSPGGSMI